MHVKKNNYEASTDNLKQTNQHAITVKRVQKKLSPHHACQEK